MKKNIVLLVFALFLIQFQNVKAQFYAGGALGFSSEGGSFDNGTTKTDKVKSSSFTFQPSAGYMLNENLWVGLKLGYMRSKEDDAANNIMDKSSTFGFAPFAEYHLLHYNKFSVGLEGQVGIAFGKSKTEASGTTTDGPKTTMFGFDVTPKVYYNFNEKVSFFTTIDVLSFGYGSITEKEDVGGVETIDKSNEFYFGVNADNIFTSGALTVGAIFKF